MRKFDLYDKVTTITETAGCVVGFVTEEDVEGVICEINTGATFEPQEHIYIVLIGQLNSETHKVQFVELAESELK